MVMTLKQRIKKNILTILVLFGMLLFTLASGYLYFGYIHSEATKHIYLNFFIVATIGLSALALTSFLHNHKLPKIGIAFNRLTKAIISLVFIASLTYCAYVTSSFTKAIEKFINFCLSKLMQLVDNGGAMSFISLYTLNSVELLDDIKSLNTVVPNLSFMILGVCIFTCFVLLTIKYVFVECSTKTTDVVLTTCFINSIEHIDSLPCKSRVAIGYLYKPLP